MKMPSIPLAQAKDSLRQFRLWLDRKASPVTIEIPSRVERIGYSLGRKTRNVLQAVRS